MKNRPIGELPNIGSANTFQLSITDLNGRTVKTETFTASSALIERENIAPGFYILQVISENNEIQLSSKVVFR